MALEAGTKLGPYEILSALGAGGMGEVYKAKDTRLDRTVAIKVLPSHLSDNARLKERFEREARECLGVAAGSYGKKTESSPCSRTNWLALSTILSRRTSRVAI